jgi:hypothetical protein
MTGAALATSSAAPANTRSNFVGTGLSPAQTLDGIYRSEPSSGAISERV